MFFDKHKKKHAAGTPAPSRLMMRDKHVASTAVQSVQMKNDQEVSTIFIQRECPMIWVCPNCECENPTNHFACCVCGTRR